MPRKPLVRIPPAEPPVSPEEYDVPPPLRTTGPRSAGVVTRREDGPSWERLPDLPFLTDNAPSPNITTPIFMHPYHSRWSKTDWMHERSPVGAPPPLTLQNSMLSPAELDALPGISEVGSMQPAELKYSGH